MPEPSPQPSTGVEPSAEAVEAMKRMLPQTAYSVHDILTAAYAIDSPAIHAAGVAEGRAHYNDFIEGLTAKLNAAGVPAMPSWPDAIDWLIGRAQSAQTEGRAAMRDEIVEWLLSRGQRTEMGWTGWSSLAADAIEAEFPTTGEKTDG